jgi:hypothetical protein
MMALLTALLRQADERNEDAGGDGDAIELQPMAEARFWRILWRFAADGSLTPAGGASDRPGDRSKHGDAREAQPGAG